VTDEITRLLHAVESGAPDATDALACAVYDHLHAVAARQMRQERDAHTLQPTMLVHDAFLRLVDQRAVHWQNRDQFYRVAAQVMRRILIDHARRRRAAKRAGGEKVPLDGLAAPEPIEEVAALGEALARLATVDPRAAQVVELRYFGDLSIEETAEVMHLSLSTVKRDWRFARAWLRRELRPDETSSLDALDAAADG
jgi:RNA polymerase sigma factor (TIGR02999 family)